MRVVTNSNANQLCLGGRDMRLFSVAMVVPNDFDLWNFRRPLITALLDAGAAVVAVAPPGSSVERLQGLGCTFAPWDVDRRNPSPLAALPSIVSLYRIYRAHRPRLVQHFTLKPNVLGVLAARAAGVPVVIATVTGLGYLWIDDRPPAGVVRPVLAWIYRRALRLADAVVFLNEDDRRTLGDGRRAVVLSGEGVDLDRFHPAAIEAERLEEVRRNLGVTAGDAVVLMVARIQRHKGVAEFATAAAEVRRRRPNTVFLLAGPIDEGNPASLPVSRLRDWEAAGAVRYLGAWDDVRELMAVADMVVLPSYREGVPRVLIEAAAMGKPIVATDVPGCRDVVTSGVNGFLVPPRDAAALAQPIGALLDDAALRRRFGAASREIAEARFADRATVDRILALYRELLAAKGVEAPAALAAAGKSPG